jgi:hypothetical protein
MTFTFQNKPDPTDAQSVSQGDLKNNAQYFQAALNKDHQIVFGDTNATTGEGRHRTVSLLNAGGTPAWPIDGTSGQLYVNAGSLFYQSNAGATNVQLVSGATVSANPGSVFLSNMTMKFGTAACAASTTTIVFFEGGGFPTNLRAVTIGPEFAAPTNAVVQIVASGLASFTIQNFGAAICTIHYIAIGN